MNLSKPFVLVAFVGVLEAIYHASNEGAFVTNVFAVSYSPYASLLGIPYWSLGLVWFPFVLVVSLWATRVTRESLPLALLALLTVGNLFTVYLWYLDFDVVRSFTAVYAALYFTNYLLTALVVGNSWSMDSMRGYVYGTVTGAVVGLLFGPFGVAACGIGGGIFGALRGYVFTGLRSSSVYPRR